MGIAGLHAYLQPYGSRIRISPTATASCPNPAESGAVGDCEHLQQTKLVIDGPALAYALWRQHHLPHGAYRAFAVVLEQFVAAVTAAGCTV